MNKLKKLQVILRRMKSVVVAYSGGVDSTFLAAEAARVLGKDNVLAVTAVSPTYPADELSCARKMARALGLRHTIISTKETHNPRFIANTQDRCFFCKEELFTRLARIGSELGGHEVIDASNASDIKDFRPGNRAKKKSGVRSPLAEAGMTKDDIRTLSRRLGLPTWNKPSAACLASRIPYGIKISKGALRQVYGAERFLKEIGCSQVRVRHYPKLCRIEVEPGCVKKVMDNRSRIVTRLKRLGYTYVTLDLEGYRSGSMNEVLKRR